MVTIYFGKNRKGQWKASLDINKVSKLDNLQECKVETVHNNRVYIVTAYLGFDYDILGGRILDVNQHSQVYHSVNAAKKSELWQSAVKKYNENPSAYIVNDFMIANDDGTGTPFYYGDVMEGKFNVQIKPVRVIE